MTTPPAPICVVDDDASVRDAVGRLVRSAGWKVETFASAQEFLATRRTNVPSCLVLDVQLPGLSGFDLQQELARADEQIAIIFLTGHGDIPMSVRAMKAGALEFLTKPVVDEELLSAIQRGIAGRERTQRQARSNLGQQAFEGIIGTSAALRTVLGQLDGIAATPSTVLILGETGTGKELVARAIHRRSKRSSRAFVNVNCAAIPPSLVASELFGHEKGAFTGALQRRIGRFELAEGGTIFLDEIGDLPAETQVALLRVLQEREFERVGGQHSIKVDVRVIAATNRDLQAAIEDGTFRSDLYYRLNVFPIQMPPLRARPGDIPLLVEHFIDRHASAVGKTIRSISKDTLERLQSYSWPGNIRELQNVVERSLVLSDSETLSVDESWFSTEPSNAVPTSPSGPPFSETLAMREKVIIEATLAETRGRVSGPFGAAVKLGVPSSTLESKIKALGVDKRRFKPDPRVARQ